MLLEQPWLAHGWARPSPGCLGEGRGCNRRCKVFPVHWGESRRCWERKHLNAVGECPRHIPGLFRVMPAAGVAWLPLRAPHTCRLAGAGAPAAASPRAECPWHVQREDSWTATQESCVLFPAVLQAPWGTLSNLPSSQQASIPHLSSGVRTLPLSDWLGGQGRSLTGKRLAQWALLPSGGLL